MESSNKPSERAHSVFGDIVVFLFLCVQGLDGALTYLGIHMWGPDIEANPLVSSVVEYAGVGTGLAGVKLFAIGLGIMLHMRRFHNLVAALTLFYIGAAIIPWVILLGASLVDPHGTNPRFAAPRAALLRVAGLGVATLEASSKVAPHRVGRPRVARPRVTRQRVVARRVAAPPTLRPEVRKLRVKHRPVAGARMVRPRVQPPRVPRPKIIHPRTGSHQWRAPAAVY